MVLCCPTGTSGTTGIYGDVGGTTVGRLHIGMLVTTHGRDGRDASTWRGLKMFPGGGQPAIYREE